MKKVLQKLSLLFLGMFLALTVQKSIAMSNSVAEAADAKITIEEYKKDHDQMIKDFLDKSLTECDHVADEVLRELSLGPYNTKSFVALNNNVVVGFICCFLSPMNSVYHTSQFRVDKNYDDCKLVAVGLIKKMKEYVASQGVNLVDYGTVMDDNAIQEFAKKIIILDDGTIPCESYSELERTPSSQQAMPEVSNQKIAIVPYAEEQKYSEYIRKTFEKEKYSEKVIKNILREAPIENGYYKIFVALIDESIGEFILYKKSENTPTGTISLFIGDNKHHDITIGKRLVQEVIKYAKKQQCEKIVSCGPCYDIAVQEVCSALGMKGVGENSVIIYEIDLKEKPVSPKQKNSKITTQPSPPDQLQGRSQSKIGSMYYFLRTYRYSIIGTLMLLGGVAWYCGLHKRMAKIIGLH